MRILVLLLLALALPACANAPGRSLFPSERPASTSAVKDSVLPSVRPGNIGDLVKNAVRPHTVSASSSGYGAICGDPNIRGEKIAPVPGRIAGCGIPNAVKVYEVDGVRLTTPATVNCSAAKALNTWVRNTARPAVGSYGGGISSLKVAASYACRTRNHQPGAKISEHGKGNAIDISAINLKNGSAMTLLGGWRDKTQGPILRKMHRGACGPFGTVLGPESDRFHQDHFHFDTARHRGGPYCR